MPANGGLKAQSLIQPGIATPINSNPFAAIYIANGKVQHSQSTGTGTQSATAYGVSASEQVGINTAIALTKKTYFVQLNPSEFPSYEGSIDVEIAEQNFTSLSQVPDLNWPESAFSDSFFKSLMKVLELYTGHSFLVCDVFGNGDSACFVPDPVTNNILVQSGPAKNANGQTLPLITNQVSGGGGGGMGVIQDPPNILYSFPSNGGGGVTCAYVDGHIQYCIKQE